MPDHLEEVSNQPNGVTLVILSLTGLNYYGLLKQFFHLISMCMCSQCDSTSLPVQRSQIKQFLFVF